MISLKFINENHRQTCCVQCGEYYRYLPIYWSGQCRNIDKSEFRTRSTKESIQIRHFKVPSAILNEIGGEEDKCVRGFFFPTFFSFIQFFPIHASLEMPKKPSPYDNIWKSALKLNYNCQIDRKSKWHSYSSAAICFGNFDLNFRLKQVKKSFAKLYTVKTVFIGFPNIIR